MKDQFNQEIDGDLSLLGVGPKILLALCPFLVLFGILNAIFQPIFQIPLGYNWLLIIGIILIILGVFVFIYSERIVKNAHDISELITSKVYGYVRHPMYASWGLGMLPGILCLFNSWLLFFTLPIYYLIVRIFIIREEKFLLTKFGTEYASYKKSVNAFFPKLKKYKPK
ncbi:MAG: methyltransferase family protein [Candidatus Thorarchaeota archaeon]